MNNDINKSSILAPLPMGEGLGERLRADFPILSREVYGKPLVYLDNGATTQKPRQVVNAITDEYYSVNANVHRGVHFLSQQATELHEASRETVRRFINARSTNEIVFTRGTTESINLLVSSFGEEFMQEGDEVILSVMEHHSNIVPWQLLAAKRGITIKVIPMNDKGELLLDEYRQLFSERTRIVSVAHVSNVLGTVNPVKEMIAFAHEQGVPVLVDGAQSIPHMPVDVQDLDAEKKLKYFLSAGYLSDEGIQLNSYNRRITSRVNVDYAATEKFLIGSRLSFARKILRLLMREAEDRYPMGN